MLRGFLLLAALLAVPGGCQQGDPTFLTQFVVDYARWRRWEQLVLFTPALTGQGALQAGMIVRALSDRGVPVGLQPLTAPRLPEALAVARHRLGAIVLQPNDLDGGATLEELLYAISEKLLFNPYISWLVITDESSLFADNTTLENKLRLLNIALVSDLVIAERTGRRQQFNLKYSGRRNNHYVKGNLCTDVQHECHHPSGGVRKSNTKNDDYNVELTSDTAESVAWSKNDGILTNQKPRITKLASARRTNELKRYKSQTLSKRSTLGGGCVGVKLAQVYKIRMDLNTSMVVEPLGCWDFDNRTANLAAPAEVEERTDLRGHALYVGVKNQSVDLEEVGVKHLLGGEGADDESEVQDNHLMEVLRFITESLNASYELVSFPKTGALNNENTWMPLLDAVTQGAVDLGLDNIIITFDRAQDMFFSHPIAKSMRNIYFKQPDKTPMSDIYLAPFSPRLIVSVATIGVALALAAALINGTNPHHPQGSDLQDPSGAMQNSPTVNSLQQLQGKKLQVLGEAVIWSISVICMQGSTWNPRNPSGCVVLISSLVFALVMYNAYAAFITSVLSVRETSIKGLHDLLESDFQIGYTKGQDESFLKTADNSGLEMVYIRGYENRVASPEVGLLRSTHGNYAFLASSRIARLAFNSLVPHSKRCDIEELVLETTKSIIALPMSLNSPYKKLINLSLLRMREGGVLERIQGRMFPPMPQCQVQSTFNSARISDVYTAFLLLVVGISCGITVAAAECLWKNRVVVAKAIPKHYHKKERKRTFHHYPKIQHVIEWQN